ncbi:MAG: hypothetical protein K8R36_04790 [Planctomycetales bacterium]|nr:hypothetical protein [Planctomycetales bacterium]
MAFQKRNQAVTRSKIDPAVQQRLRSMAAELRQIIYGEQGCPEWGTLFREIEQDGLSVGLELARLLMEQSAGEQVRHMPPEAMRVPDDVVQPAGTNPARLETPAGEVCWEQPCGTLQQARKAFFPSGEGIGAEP